MSLLQSFSPKTSSSCFNQLVRFVLAFILMLGLQHSVLAIGEPTATTSTQQASEQTDTVVDPFGRQTPRSTLQGFISALSQDDATLASNYLSLNVGDNSVEVVRQVKLALDAGGRLYPELQISNEPTGNLTDQLPPDQEKIGTVNLNERDIDLVLIRKTAEHGNQYWQFAPQTIEAITNSNLSVEPSLVDRYTFAPLQGKTIGGYDIADMVAVLILGIVCVLFFSAVIGGLYFLLKHYYPKVRKKPLPFDEKVILPLALVITSAVLSEVMVYAGVSVTVREPVNRIKDIIGWFALTWLLLRVVDAVFNRAERQSYKRNHTERVSILSLARKIVKALLLILATIFIFGNLGFDLTTGIAALGVGGLALALGAQKLIENLVGSVVVVADQPVRVGDYCRFGTQEGTVIDIGIRSTRIRTLDRTIVTVPNGEFSSMQIENYAQKDMFQFLHQLYLKRPIEATVLKEFVDGIDTFVEDHELTNSEWNQVRILALRQDCIVVEVRCYMYANGAADFYNKQTRFIIELLAKIEEYPVEHALPTQRMVVEQSHFNDISDQSSEGDEHFRTITSTKK